MKNFKKRLYSFQDELWEEFNELVKKGAKISAHVRYPRRVNPPGLMLDTEDYSYFLATEIIANPHYKMHLGEDLIIGTGKVEFVDSNGNTHIIEPEITDLHWLVEVLEYAR